MVPVKMFYWNRRIPLVDVNVDVMLRPANDEKWDDFVIVPNWIVDSGSKAASIFHPKHYSLGTVVREVSESPIQLQPGRHYFLLITTRRGNFYEKINIDHGDGPGGWNISQCLYRVRDDKLLRGKCD
jgi:hypothetical protein